MITNLTANYCQRLRGCSLLFAIKLPIVYFIDFNNLN